MCCIGHNKIRCSREQSNEAGYFNRSHSLHYFLHAMWGSRLCCIWQRRTWKFSNRLRILRALLAGRVRQLMHRNSSCRSLPGKLQFFSSQEIISLSTYYLKIFGFDYCQVFAQPIYGAFESWSREKWPGNKFITAEYSCGYFKLSLFSLVWRSGYVIFTTTIAMLFPFFNGFVGLIGAVSFWPLTVYFPIRMYIARTKIPRFSFTWTWMQILSGVCLIIALLSAAGSIEGLVTSVRAFKPFHSVS